MSANTEKRGTARIKWGKIRLNTLVLRDFQSKGDSGGANTPVDGGIERIKKVYSTIT